jgi:hypothetical protein
VVINCIGLKYDFGTGLIYLGIAALALGLVSGQFSRSKEPRVKEDVHITIHDLYNMQPTLEHKLDPKYVSSTMEDIASKSTGKLDNGDEYIRQVSPLGHGKNTINNDFYVKVDNPSRIYLSS